MFEGLKYPGHEKVIVSVVMGFIVAVLAAVLDKAYMVTFGVAPIIVVQMIMNDAGLSWRTHKKASSLFFVGYLAWMGMVTAVRIVMLAHGA